MKIPYRRHWFIGKNRFRIPRAEYRRIVATESWRYKHEDFMAMQIYRWRLNRRINYLSLAISTIAFIVLIISHITL